MKQLERLEKMQMNKDRPDFRPGDTLKVYFKVVEGGRERAQSFQGIAIRKQGSGSKKTFTVRKVSFGVGVEKTFPLHSPKVTKIKVISRGKVRRSKLHYLREKTGRKARVKEKR